MPPTAIVRIEHSAFFDSSADAVGKASPFRSRKTKVGSLQRFVSHDGFAEEYSPSVFSQLEVQRIAVLDIRTFNTDRHGANLLVLRPGRAGGPPRAGGAGAPRAADDDDAHTHRLVPIDHGFSLPAAITVPCFEWSSWPQARAPLTPEVLAYIAAIDVEACLLYTSPSPRDS